MLFLLWINFCCGLTSSYLLRQVFNFCCCFDTGGWTKGFHTELHPHLLLFLIILLLNCSGWARTCDLPIPYGSMAGTSYPSKSTTRQSRTSWHPQPGSTEKREETGASQPAYSCNISHVTEHVISFHLHNSLWYILVEQGLLSCFLNGQSWI